MTFEPVVLAHAAALAAALQRVRGDDLAELQRVALAGMRAGIEAGDVAFARVWQAIGRCARAERGRREQAVIDFADDLAGPAEGGLAADGWGVPEGWEVEVDRREFPEGYHGG